MNYDDLNYSKDHTVEITANEMLFFRDNPALVEEIRERMAPDVTVFTMNNPIGVFQDSITVKATKRILELENRGLQVGIEQVVDYLVSAMPLITPRPLYAVGLYSLESYVRINPDFLEEKIWKFGAAFLQPEG